jgi:hypothetical protein
MPQAELKEFGLFFYAPRPLPKAAQEAHFRRNISKNQNLT